MLDVIGGIASGAAYSVVIGAIVGLARWNASQKLLAFAAAAALGIAVVAITALGGFASGATGSVPAPAIAFFTVLALLFGAWASSPTFRNGLLSIPLEALIGLNVARIAGVFFLLLAAEDRLSSPFAASAGWGDIVTGAVALPLALLVFLSPKHVPTAANFWNAFGALDLVAAITLGLLSAPSTPLRIFTEGPGTLAMTQLPWVIVPTALVPFYLLIHWTIATKIGALKPRLASGRISSRPAHHNV
jgi:hypothetical protein